VCCRSATDRGGKQDRELLGFDEVLSIGEADMCICKP
jgi:hypothetical protein